MKLTVAVKSEHDDIASAVTWSPDCQLISCSDDKVLAKWGADGSSSGKITNITAYSTDVHWFPGSGKQAPDMFALSCADGTFKFVSRSGREEKNVKAHDGAVIKIRWSHDGSALVTAGEDGEIKIWSKSGNFRSSLASTGVSVYACCWGPDDDQVLFSSGNKLVIKTVQASRKNLEWKAHDGLVLCVDWNLANNHIVSGGEDCTYKVWDSFGRQLYSSRPMEHVVNSVGWCPNGEYFAVGSHNLIRLCDKTGWTHSRERLQVGSMMDIAWTSDGTQFACPTGSGSVVFAQVVGRRFEWKNTEVTLLEPRKLRVQDVANETLEDLEFAKDRVVEIGLGFDMLVVTTTTQCYIYNLGNLNTPIIFNIKAPPHFVKLCKRHFLTVDLVTGIQVISYEGRPICNPKFQGLRHEYVTRDSLALSPDTIAVVDTVDAKIVQVLDATTGRMLGKLTHSTEVTSLLLNQHANGPQERLLAFTDKNRDMFVTNLQGGGGGPGGGGNNPMPVHKLHSHVESFAFNDETDMLVALADGRLRSWYFPQVCFVDMDLLPLTESSSDAAEFGHGAQILAFSGNRIVLRKVDGSVLFTGSPLDVSLLYEYARAGKWEEATRLCRHQKGSALWGCLAGMALAKRQLDMAESALAELNEVAKVEYIQQIKQIPSEEGKNAELALFRRQPDEAERILLQASPPLIYRAIKMNLLLYRWSRALELALKYKTHLDTVVAYRSRHLEEFGKAETNKNFLQYGQDVQVDWQQVAAAEQAELENEGRRRGGGRK